MPHAHVQSCLECWQDAAAGNVPWRIALEKSAAMLGARAIAFGTLGGAGETQMLGIYPSDSNAIGSGFASGFLARAESEETGYLRSEIATASFASETVTVWIVALLEHSNPARLLRDVAQAAANAAMQAAQADATRVAAPVPERDLTESEMRLARFVLNPRSQRALH